MPETTIQWVSAAVLLFMVYIGAIRNTQVSRFKGKLIDAISDYEKTQISKHNYLDFEAWDLYDQIGYDKLVFMFWKSPKSFIPNKLKDKLGDRI